MTVEETAQIVMMATAVYTEQAKYDLYGLVLVWHRIVGQLSFALAEKAMVKHLSNSSFFPKPADLLNAASEIVDGQSPDPDVAWAEVLKKVSTYGRKNMPVNWSHPCVEQAAMRLYGGWALLCRQLNDQTMASDRANFLRIYQACRKHHRDNLIKPAELLTPLGSENRKALGGVETN